jgi:hypothetical protein
VSNQKQQRKAYFEVLVYPILDPPKQEYYIYDAYGNQVELSPEEAATLLDWLSQHSNELPRLVHPELDGCITI